MAKKINIEWEIIKTTDAGKRMNVKIKHRVVRSTKWNEYQFVMPKLLLNEDVYLTKIQQWIDRHYNPTPELDGEKLIGKRMYQKVG